MANLKESQEKGKNLQNRINNLELTNSDLQSQLSSKATKSSQTASLNQMLGRKNSEINLLKNENSEIQTQIINLTTENVEILQDKQNLINFQTQQQEEIDELKKKNIMLM